MRCPRCEEEVSTLAVACSNCGLDLTQQWFNAPQKVKLHSHLGFAIFATLCFCWPLGIIAIIYAARAQASFAAGLSINGANQARTARIFAWLAVLSGAVVSALYLMSGR